MGKRWRDLIWLILLACVCGLIMWHVVSWHSNGTYLEMFQWIMTDKGYITVLYNLGLMVVFGLLLGLFMQRLTNFAGYKVNKIKHFDDEGADGKK
jgi:hypothetical protein